MECANCSWKPRASLSSESRPKLTPINPPSTFRSTCRTPGFKIIPVPVYYPDVTEILGEKVHRQLQQIPDEVDMVNVFRRPQDIPAHLDDLLAKKPKSVWMQLGISHDAVAEQLARAGIKVVQDRCLMVDHRRLALIVVSVLLWRWVM